MAVTFDVYAPSKYQVTKEIDRLVALAVQGDRAVFDELVRRTHAEAYTLAMRLTNSPDDAADVVQDAYLRIYKALPGFRGDSQFSTWMYRIVSNCASTQMKKRARHRHDQLNEIQAGPASFDLDYDSDASTPLTREDLSIALAALPEGLRQVVVLRDIYDLPHEAIAQELGITAVTAKVRLHRARKRLREGLLPKIERAQNGCD